jgi:hypothetical protein
VFLRLLVLLAMQGLPLNARQTPDPAAPPAPGPLAATPPAAPAGPPAPAGDLDALMARVLAHRDETWKRLNDYVLDEREALEIFAPGRLPLHRARSEYTWFVREGVLVRSPVRSNGVTVREDDRRQYEANWLAGERRREARRRERAQRAATAEGGGPPESTAPPPPDATAPPPDSTATLPGAAPTDAGEVATQAIEPRFVSEAYFLRFRFEPGNYYFVGRETLDDREVLRIEYYPTQLFKDDEPPPPEQTREVSAAQGPHEKDQRQRTDEDRERELDFERRFNKVALVTLWVDPAAEQIVRYTFDNVDFNFLPGRSIVRLETVRASMTMGRFLDGAWLPRGLEMTGAVTLAVGRFSVRYGRDFSNYRQAEATATIRAFGPAQ